MNRLQTNLLDNPGSFFAPPLALLPPAEVAEDGQDQGHDAPEGQVAEGGACSPSEPDDACKEGDRRTAPPGRSKASSKQGACSIEVRRISLPGNLVNNPCRVLQASSDAISWISVA